jgi:hypothetical protein
MEHEYYPNDPPKSDVAPWLLTNAAMLYTTFLNSFGRELQNEVLAQLQCNKGGR